MIRFDIDTDEIKRVARELQASEKQVGQAIGRALRRTAGTMRARSQKALAQGLDVRRANTLRTRLKELRLGRKGAGAQEIALWFGLNDMRISDLKGRPVQARKGAKFRDQEYPGGFVQMGKRGYRTIFRRRAAGRYPLVEETYGIKDRADIILEDEVFADLPDVFMKNFIADLRARTVFGVGSKYG